MKKYIKQNRSYFIGALCCTLVSSVFAVILQFFKGDVLDYAVAGQMSNTVKYAVLLIGFILLEVFFYFCYRRFLAKFVVGCTKSLKQDIFKSILERSYVEYKEIPQGEYISKYTVEADAIKGRYFDMWLSFCEIVFKIIFVAAALLILDWRIAIITLVLLTTPLYIPKLIEKRLQKAQTACMEATADHLSKINDWLSGFEIVKNFSIEQTIIDKFEKSNDFTMSKSLYDAQLSAVAQLITTLISYLSYFLVLVCATWLVLRREFSPGDFFIAIGMIDQLSYPLISLAQIIRLLVSVKPTCEGMEEFLSYSDKTKQVGLKSFDKEICFQGVTFGYEASRAVLNDVNFRMEKGKRYLFCGPSGCGKTTAINLLLRYFDVKKGQILIDGKSVSDYTNTYACITVLRQDAVLFRDTLRNNLTMYRDVEDEELIRLLVKLGLEKYANAASLDTLMEENGSNLSGGERKRVCLARALLRDTDILILDEPLANLDTETAQRIEDLIFSIDGRTIIVVSHQFSDNKVCQFDRVINFAMLHD